MEWPPRKTPEQGLNLEVNVIQMFKQVISLPYYYEGLDWVWNEEEISDACVHLVGDNGAQVFFHQDYSCGTAAARGTQPMSDGQHFWEIKMDSPVYGTAMVMEKLHSCWKS